MTGSDTSIVESPKGTKLTAPPYASKHSRLAKPPSPPSSSPSRPPDATTHGRSNSISPKSTGTTHTSSTATEKSAISRTDSSKTTDDDDDPDNDRPALNFAKRKISSSQARSSYSQLSSMTANSPERIHVPAEIMTDEPVLAADDQERIRNPASAAFRKPSVDERIGHQQPFGNENGNDKSPQSSVSSTSQLSTNFNDTNTPPASLARKPGFPTDLASALTSQPSMRRTKRYEPARVVLHKSDSGIAMNLRNDGNSDGGYFDSSTYTAPYSAGSGQTSFNIPRQLSEPQVVSPSLVSSLASSPEERLGAPLKHIREPKHPLYIPAVLRPTDFNNYTNDTQRQLTAYPASARRQLMKQHWTRDANVDSCAKCHEKFTYFKRRHHCRKCGGIFCAKDSNHTIGLDRILNFNILGVPCRACDSCANEFAMFCLNAPRLNDNATQNQPPVPAVEPEEIEVGGGGYWSTF